MMIIRLRRKVAVSRSHEMGALNDPEMADAANAAAIDALSLSGDHRLVAIINRMALAADPASEDLPRLLRALGASQHPAGEPAVRHWLFGPTWWVRAAAVEAAGRIGVDALAPELASLLGDPDWWVRFRAGEALVRLGPEGMKLLELASRKAPEPARSAARLTMAEQGIGA